MREPINKRSKIMDKIINTVIFFGSLAIGALRLVSEARRGPGRI
jgi:preprotein translocase subunit SecY